MFCGLLVILSPNRRSFRLLRAAQCRSKSSNYLFLGHSQRCCESDWGEDASAPPRKEEFVYLFYRLNHELEISDNKGRVCNPSSTMWKGVYRWGRVTLSKWPDEPCLYPHGGIASLERKCCRERNHTER